MGYTNIKADRQHDADQRRIRELEAQLRRERNQNATQTTAVIQPQQQTAQGGHVTIEKTSKPLKKRIVLSWLLMLFGIFVAAPLGAVMNFEGTHGGIQALCAIPFVAGILLWIVTKVQIWWRHG